MAKKEHRFEFLEESGNIMGAGAVIIVDKQTGVQYLMTYWGSVGGTTVLVDQEGKPIIDYRYGS